MPAIVTGWQPSWVVVPGPTLAARTHTVWVPAGTVTVAVYPRHLPSFGNASATSSRRRLAMTVVTVPPSRVTTTRMDAVELGSAAQPVTVTCVVDTVALSRRPTGFPVVADAGVGPATRRAADNAPVSALIAVAARRVLGMSGVLVNPSSERPARVCAARPYICLIGNGAAVLSRGVRRPGSRVPRGTSWFA